MMCDRILCLTELHYRYIAQIVGAAIVLLLVCAHVVRGADHVVDFEDVEVGKPTPSWEGRGLRIELLHAPKKNKAVGRITFFPHLGTGHKGVVNAMANEAIPLRINFITSAKKVTATLWGSTTSAAYLEAFDKDGKSLGRQAIEKVPVRKAPEEQIPFFELSVEATGIAYVTIGGSKAGGFVAVDELRWVSESDSK